MVVSIIRERLFNNRVAREFHVIRFIPWCLPSADLKACVLDTQASGRVQTARG